MSTGRIFIAVNLPPEVKEKIWRGISAGIPSRGTIKVPMDNLHITISFLGNLPREKINALAKKLEFASETKKFEVGLKGAGHFRNKAIWLGVEKGALELIGLRKRVIEAVGTGDGKFHPHVTIARNKFLNSGDVDSAIEKINSAGFSEAFLAESLDVMESVLSPDGARHSVVGRIGFR